MSRKFGDRKDGKLIRELDSLHYITPILYPNRCDNEAFISERIDLTEVNKYLEEKNKDNTGYKYNLFQLIVTAMLRVITQMHRMNRFIANSNMYERNEITASFVVKKEFSEDGGEALAFLHSSPSDNIDCVHEKIYKQITSCRSDKKDSSSASMDLFNKMPRFISKALVKFVCVLDRHGLVPSSLIASDPYYSSVVLTNLGSIKLHSGYHHLTNWGTNSIFVAIGEIKKRPFYNEDGSFLMKDSVDLGLTIDERIADGYYYSIAVRMLKHLLEHPQLLEESMDTRVNI